MAVQDDVTLLGSLRRDPVRMGLCAVGPLVLAVFQLVNSAVTGMPYAVSVSFAVLMVTSATLFTRHNLARRRVHALESTSLRATVD